MCPAPAMFRQRKQALKERLEQMREHREWCLFQQFAIGLLEKQGYKNIRPNAVQNDFGRDAVACTPHGERCFVAVSFECTLAKIRHDAKRWTEDPSREPAEVMVFVTHGDPAGHRHLAWAAVPSADLGQG